MANRILISMLAGALCALRAWAAEPEKSVIQITVFSQQPNWDMPWRFDQVRKFTGSGFVIKGKRIVTNAHVADWPREILVRRYQDPRPYVAHVKFSGPDCDLAILEVEEADRFFSGLEALEFGDLPKVRTEVVTYGYPAGGEQISYTRGVVSRIELQQYVNVGNRAYLAAQTDAAINPGNSGGPVIQDGKVVGVAFQGQPGLENTGFFIPPPVVEHFLKDVEDGRYDGFPQAGIRFVSMQNPAYRKLLGLPDNDLGARVDRIFDVPTTRDLMKVDDVVLKVGNYDVGSDGTIVYEGNRVFLGVAITEVQSGEMIRFKVWRDKQEKEINVPVFTYTKDKNEGNQHEMPPRYYVYGGLVFTPLSLDYMRTIRGSFTDTGISDLYYELTQRRHEDPEKARTEAIVLSTVLPHAVTANFAIKGQALVDKINGVKIDRLEDVIKAFETASGEGQHLIEFYPDRGFECLDRAEARAANTQILKNYAITKDRRL